MPKKKTNSLFSKINLSKRIKKLTPVTLIGGTLVFIGIFAIAFARFTPLFSSKDKLTSTSSEDMINQTPATETNQEEVTPETSQTSPSSSTGVPSGTTSQSSKPGQTKTPSGTSTAREPSYTIGTAYGSFELNNSSECKFVLFQNISGVGGDASVIFNVGTSPYMGSFGGTEVLSFSKTNYESKQASKTVYFNPPTSGEANVMITVNIVVKDYKGSVLRTGPTKSFKCPHAAYEYSVSDFNL